MKINSKAFGAAGEAVEKKIADSESPAPRGSFIPRGGDHSDQDVSDQEKLQRPEGYIQTTIQSPPPVPATPSPTEAGVPMFTRPRKPAPTLESESTTKQENQAPNESATHADKPEKKPIWNWAWKRKKAKIEVEPKSSAMLPNKSRPAVIFGAIFVVGLIIGPWIAQKATPGQQVPAGPNPAVQAVVDTLKGGTLGSAQPVPAAAFQPPQDTATSTSTDQPPTPIPAGGEERYAAMLEKMKQGSVTPQEPVKIVPKINQSTLPSASLAPSRQEQPSASADPYPKESIPLAIEKGAGQISVEVKPIAIERSMSPSGKYIVLRIERNPQGHPAALLMPIGGRQAVDAAWVFIGDATSDGMVIENITSNTVVLQTANGRSLQIALH